jgi:hypothetical protein
MAHRLLGSGVGGSIDADNGAGAHINSVMESSLVGIVSRERSRTGRRLSLGPVRFRKFGGRTSGGWGTAGVVGTIEARPENCNLGGHDDR